MQTIWFKKWGWSYLPVHPIGIMVTSLAIVFLVPVYVAIIRTALLLATICTICLCTQPVLYSGGNRLQEKQI